MFFLIKWSFTYIHWFWLRQRNRKLKNYEKINEFFRNNNWFWVLGVGGSAMVVSYWHESVDLVYFALSETFLEIDRMGLWTERIVRWNANISRRNTCVCELERTLTYILHTRMMKHAFVHMPSCTAVTASHQFNRAHIAKDFDIL